MWGENDKINLYNERGEEVLSARRKNDLYSIKPIYQNRIHKIKGLSKMKYQDLRPEACKIAKTRRVSFQSNHEGKTNKLLHTDVCRPKPTYSLGRAEYFLTSIGDNSKKVTTYPMQYKSGVFDCFLKFQKRNERFLGRKVVAIRADNGKEFLT